jgi:branched-chain amino acid transport system ATP-binding protein
MLRPSGGSVRLAGEEVTGLPSHRLVARGMAHAPEGRGIFLNLTTLENLELGAWLRKDPAGVRADLERYLSLFPVLAERRGQVAGTLSGGEQQMLAVARALMSRPRLLLLDEPSLGLAPRVARSVYEALGTISRSGTTILLVEQNARLALGAAARGAILEAGRVVLEGTARDLTENEDVRQVYLGVGTEETPAKGWRLYRKRRRW